MARSRTRSQPRRPEGGHGERTYSIWWFVAGFVALTSVGLFLVLTLTSDEGSVMLQPPQTLPDSAAPADHDGSAVDTAEQGPTATSAPTTSAPDAPAPDQPAPDQPSAPTSTVGGAAFPDGSPGPEGATSVLVSDGATSITFAAPADARIPDGADLSALPGYTAVVPPTSVIPASDGGSLDVRVACARSDSEFLAQLVVVESDVNITVTAVVLVPDRGPACAVGRARTVTVPLLVPLAGRALVVVPPGTDLFG